MLWVGGVVFTPDGRGAQSHTTQMQRSSYPTDL